MRVQITSKGKKNNLNIELPGKGSILLHISMASHNGSLHPHSELSCTKNYFPCYPSIII